MCINAFPTWSLAKQRQSSQIGIDSSIFGSRHDSNPSTTFHSSSQLGILTPDTHLLRTGLSYFPEGSMLLPTHKWQAPQIPSGIPSSTSDAIPYLDDPAGTGLVCDFSQQLWKILGRRRSLKSRFYDVEKLHQLFLYRPKPK
jgi:hypothetical protein